MAKMITSRKPQRRSRGGFPIDNEPGPKSLDSSTSDWFSIASQGRKFLESLGWTYPHETRMAQKVVSIHDAQLLTCMKSAQVKIGLLMNFNVTTLKEGIKRFVL
jgi:hypothetical protein